MDDSADDLDMDIDHRFRPNSGNGGRIILLGDGTEITTEAHDSEMFDNGDEDRDLDSQVNKFQSEGSSAQSNGSTKQASGSASNNTQETTDSPSSITTEKSEGTERQPTELPIQPIASPASGK
jgi:protein phosphatase 2C family protein 2/3